MLLSAPGIDIVKPAAKQQPGQTAGSELEPMQVKPQQEFPHFDEPAYRHRKRPESVQPVAASEPKEAGAEAVPFSRLDREDILPSMFGGFK